MLVKDLVAGYLIVVREGVTTHGDIQNFLKAMETSGAKPMGFLKVGCDPSEGKSGKYKYKSTIDTTNITLTNIIDIINNIYPAHCCRVFFCRLLARICKIKNNTCIINKIVLE